MNIRPLLPLFALSLLVGCSHGSSSPSMADKTAPPAANEAPKDTTHDATRAIAEADIVQLDGGHLYALSKAGTLSIIDVSAPAKLEMLGQVGISGEPFEMYLRGDRLIVMTNKSFARDGSKVEPVSIDGHVTATPVVSSDDEGAGIVAVDISNPRSPNALTTSPVPGTIADSRIVGDVLYVVTYESSTCYSCGAVPRTVVTSFTIAENGAFRQVKMLTYEDTENVRNAWGDGSFKRSVYATNERLYVGGHSANVPSGSNHEGAIDVLDITDPSGRFVPVVRFEVAGAITERWQMDESEGIFRVVSQHGVGYLTSGLGEPIMETFTVGSTFAANGTGTMTLPRQEALKTVRFDGKKAYAITYRETDPLFVLDFSDAAHPRQRGQITMPGYMFHLEPFGDRLVGLGVDASSAEGDLDVTLFDVSDLDAPKILDRVAFGSRNYASSLPEDQDRIEKAFRVLDGGLIVAPFAGQSAAAAAADCSTTAGGVQLISWKDDELQKDATLSVTGTPRRALLNQGELIAVSDSHVTTFDVQNASPSADLMISDCAGNAHPQNVPTISNENPSSRTDYWDDDQPYACSMGPARHARTPSSLGAAVFGLLLGLGVRRRSGRRAGSK